MRFERIKINGFKGFADHVDLPIEDGLTGIVGPNGCGKSNLVEAFRWVMGESRPSVIRGEGMEDVIFSGSGSRPVRSYAEVRLEIENSNPSARGMFRKDSKLEILRRITRDGGSTFRANGRELRQRDVQILFADSSSGARSPALVRQGQINEIVNAKPKARTAVLEEAAGIAGLGYRRHEAELKLEATGANLQRVEDVLEQLRVQLASLSRQAKQAARYRKLGAQLRRAEGLFLYLQWKDADHSRQSAAFKLLELTRETAEKLKEAREAQRAREEREAVVPPLREKSAEDDASIQRLRVELRLLEDQESRALQLIESLNSRIRQLGMDIERETGLQRDASAMTFKLEKQLRELSELEDCSGARLEMVRAESEAAALAVEQQEAELDRRNRRAAELIGRFDLAKRVLENSKTAFEEAKRKEAKIIAEIEAADRRLIELKAAFDKADTEQASAAVEAEKAVKALAETETNRAVAQEREANSRSWLSEAEAKLKACQGEAFELERILRRNDEYKDPIVDKVRVKAGAEAAISAAFGNDILYPEAVDDGTSGWRSLSDFERPPKLPGKAIPLSEFADVPSALRRSLSQVGLVEREALRDLQPVLAPGQCLVTSEGDLSRWDGFALVAEDSSQSAAHRLRHMNRLDELRVNQSEIESERDNARREFQKLAEELASANEANLNAREARVARDEELAGAGKRLSVAEAQLNSVRDRLVRLDEARAEVHGETEAADAARVKAEIDLAACNGFDAAKEAVADAKKVVEAARSDLLEKSYAYDGMRREEKERRKRIAELETELKNWRLRKESASGRVKDLTEQKSGAESDLAKTRNAPEEFARNRARLRDMIGESEILCKQSASALHDAEEELRLATVRERDSERANSQAREARARAEALEEAAKERADLLLARIAEERRSDPEKLATELELDPDSAPSLESQEVEVNRLKRLRDALGSVNLRAEEDMAEIGDEVQVLEREKADLDAAIEKIRAGIAGLNNDARARIVKTFESVNRNFSSLFKYLFGGGEARLELVDSNDPLKAGLEIYCRPPGKRLVSLSLLSGGEKSLTAIALIFSFFLANPAPICVLDEVDAPLDDTNVSRFCDLLDEIRRRTKTRFLIVTHHPTTMARMDRLYGVTMQEKGVSQIVSVDLRSAELLAA
ncbi:MAG: chromosome segregation protein SMC [Albidovulum sp.]|nr:chromosome segregation protein SMC [Albidovulum sp.]